MEAELREIITDLRKYKRLVFRAFKNGMELQRRDGRIYTYNTPSYVMGWLRQLDLVLAMITWRETHKQFIRHKL